MIVENLSEILYGLIETVFLACMSQTPVFQNTIANVIRCFTNTLETSPSNHAELFSVYLKEIVSSFLGAFRFFDPRSRRQLGFVSLQL